MNETLQVKAIVETIYGEENSEKTKGDSSRSRQALNIICNEVYYI
jgi:hypothetical protein